MHAVEHAKRYFLNASEWEIIWHAATIIYLIMLPECNSEQS